MYMTIEKKDMQDQVESCDVPGGVDESLTKRMQDFCLFYAIGNTRGNQTQSYLRAFETKSEKEAGNKSSVLMRRPEIKHEIQRLTLEIRQRQVGSHVVTENQILRGLSQIAESDITDIASFSGRSLTLKSSADIQRLGLGTLIRSIKQTKHGISLQLWDKPKSYELMMRAYGMLTENHAILFKDLSDVPKDRLQDVQVALQGQIQELKEIKKGLVGSGLGRVGLGVGVNNEEKKTPPLQSGLGAEQVAYPNSANTTLHTKNPKESNNLPRDTGDKNGIEETKEENSVIKKIMYKKTDRLKLRGKAVDIVVVDDPMKDIKKNSSKNIEKSEDLERDNVFGISEEDNEFSELF